MNGIDIILSRRSIRKYKKGIEVSDNQLQEILKAAMYAPSAVNKQPWHFIVFTETEKINAIVELHPGSAMMQSASKNILVCWDETLEHDKGYGILDCSAAVQNMLLAAHSMNLGACWIGIHPREKRMEEVARLFNLPEHIKPLAIVSLGYSDEEKRIPERFKPERIHFEKW
jgi:nitroreductase